MPSILPKLAYLCLAACLQVFSWSALAQAIARADKGEWTVDTHQQPGMLLVLDRTQQIARRYPLATLDGKQLAQFAEVHHAEPRQSFVVVLKGVAEMWELSYNPSAEPIYDGYVHDYKMGEGIALAGFLNPRRTTLDSVLDDFFFDPSYANVMGASREGRGQVVNLDVRRKIADLDLPGMPHLGSGITWELSLIHI